MLVSSVVIASGTLYTTQMNIWQFLGSRILPMLHNSSAFFKMMLGAGHNVWPIRNYVMSEPVILWNAGSGSAVSGWRFQAIIKDLIGKNFGFFRVPAFVCISLILFAGEWAGRSSKTSMTLDNTTAVVEWIWPLCKIRWISAFSIVLLIQLYRGSYRKPFQSWGTGTSGVSINHPMDGFPYLQFLFHLLLTSSQRQGQSWQSVCHYGSKCYEFVNLWNPTAITSAWISIFRDASSGTTIDSGHYTLLPSSSKGKDYFCPVFNVLPISASVRGTLRCCDSVFFKV